MEGDGANPGEELSPISIQLHAIMQEIVKNMGIQQTLIQMDAQSKLNSMKRTRRWTGTEYVKLPFLYNNMQRLYIQFMFQLLPILIFKIIITHRSIVYTESRRYLPVIDTV